jgi:zinc protease
MKASANRPLGHESPEPFRRGFPVPSLTLALCLVLSLGSCARGPKAGAPGILRTQLENGLRVVIVPNALAPVATTVVNYLVGSNEAPSGFPGMAHAQEHMMFRGSPGLSADQLADIAASMGGAFDADTQQTVTQYFFTVPAEDLDVALRIEAIRMGGALDSQALWEKERGAIEQEVSRDLSNPTYVFYTQLLAAMFKGTVYAHDALGTTASFNETTAAMLKDFHDAWYAPNNAILVVVGNVQPEAVLREIQRLFGSLPAKKLPARPSIALEPVEPDSLSLTTDLPYGLALVCFRLPGSQSPDYPAARVMADVLSSQRGDLYALVPEGKALAAGFSMNALPEAGLGFAYAAYPAGGDGKALIKRMQEVLAETVKKGVEPDLVAAAKRRELTDSQFRRPSRPPRPSKK